MIKLKADQENGRTLLAFGLSRGNLVELMRGNPIHVNLEEMGMPDMDFMIFGDIRKDDAELADSLSEFIGPDTIVRGSTDPGRKDG